MARRLRPGGYPGGFPPGNELIDLARDCRRVWASDLKRSIESAKSLGVAFEISRTFREHEQPTLRLPWVRFSTKSWDLIGKSLWALGYSPGAESFRDAKARAQRAAEKLRDEALAYGPTMLLGHGFFNLLIARKLKDLGFTPRVSPQFSYWGYREFVFSGSGRR